MNRPLRASYETGTAADWLQRKDEVLAVFEFGCSPLDASDPRHVPVALRPLDASPRLEVWRTSGPVRTGAWDGLNFAQGEMALMSTFVTWWFTDQGVPYDDIATVTRVHLRYEGTDNALPVMLDEPEIMRRDFEAQHRQRYGFISPEKKVFASALEVEATGGGAHIAKAGQAASVERRELPPTDARVRYYCER